jgi:hypothetical protein
MEYNTEFLYAVLLVMIIIGIPALVAIVKIQDPTGPVPKDWY